MAKLLLVEDDNNLREIYQARLSAEGYEIVAAQNGEEALSVAKQARPDLIISDVMMPRISGFEMLDILRDTPELRDTKVIMLTALGQAEDQTRAGKLGADKYLVKSQVTLEDIVNCARDLLAGAATAAGPAAALAGQTTSPADPAVALPEPALTPSPAAAPAPIQPSGAAAIPEPSLTTSPVTDNTPLASSMPAPQDSSFVATAVPTSMPSPSQTVPVVDPDPLAAAASQPVPSLTPPTDAAAASQPLAPPAPAPTAVDPLATPVASAPQATPDLTSVISPSAAPVRPPADLGTSEAQSLASEEDAIAAQINAFAQTAANTMAPAAEPAAPVETPSVTPAENTAENDATLATAIAELTSAAEAPPAPAVAPSQKPAPVDATVSAPSTEPPTPPAEPQPAVVTSDAPVPAPEPAAPPAAAASAETAPEPQPQAAPESEQVNVAGKKVISPINDIANGPDLNELLAKEAAKEQAGQAVAPGSGAVVVDTTEPDPNTPAAPKPTSEPSFDPNSIAL